MNGRLGKVNHYGYRSSIWTHANVGLSVEEVHRCAMREIMMVAGQSG